MDYLPRKIEKKLERWINREEIILIKGPRQSGKTTFLKHLNLPPLEVKIIPKIEKSLYSFIRTYKPERAVIMNLNFSEVFIKKINSTELAFIPCFYL